MEIFVAVNTDVFHFVMVDIHPICSEIAQDDNILKGIRDSHFSTLSPAVGPQSNRITGRCVETLLNGHL